MLLNEKTLQVFGYTFESLSEKSSKRLLVTCDYCNKEYEVTKKNRHINHLVIQKDACDKCKYIKMKEINLLKYGCENVFQMDSTKAKIKSTNLEKYGDESATRDKLVKEKIKKTNLEKYGATTFLGSEAGQENMKKVCLEKYGVENASSSRAVKEKRKQTCKEKFGKDTYLGSEDCKRATEEKFGVDNVFKLAEFQEKSRNTRILTGDIELYKGKTVAEWAEYTGFSRRVFASIVKEKGWELAISHKREGSRCEEVVRKFLDDRSIPYKFTKGLAGYIPDFQINNVIIECDSLYFHSDFFKQDKFYHYKKFERYKDLGYKPLFFTEEDIHKKSNIVFSIVMDALDIPEQIIDARDLEFRQLSRSEQWDFFSQNHINGVSYIGDISYGLTHGNLVYFGVNLTGNSINRFCSKIGYRILNDLEVCFNFLDKPILIDLDRRFEDRDLSTIKMNLIGIPISFKWTNNKKTFPAEQFPSNSGYDAGLFKIWDCGQAKWRLL